jgi:succinate dehydrogenase / fumarate reductase flavoprotein subunit
MHTLVGIIRNEAELREAKEQIARYVDRAQKMSVEGHRQYNPGWHLAMDLKSMLTVSEAIARGADTRKESRGGHTRDDYPNPENEWGTVNVVIRQGGDGAMQVTTEPLPAMPTDLAELFKGDK